MDEITVRLTKQQAHLLLAFLSHPDDAWPPRYLGPTLTQVRQSLEHAIAAEVHPETELELREAYGGR